MISILKKTKWRDDTRFFSLVPPKNIFVQESGHEQNKFSDKKKFKKILGPKKKISRNFGTKQISGRFCFWWRCTDVEQDHSSNITLSSLHREIQKKPNLKKKKILPFSHKSWGFFKNKKFLFTLFIFTHNSTRWTNKLSTMGSQGSNPKVKCKTSAPTPEKKTPQKGIAYRKLEIDIYISCPFRTYRHYILNSHIQQKS